MEDELRDLGIYEECFGCVFIGGSEKLVDVAVRFPHLLLTNVDGAICFDYRPASDRRISVSQQMSSGLTLEVALSVQSPVMRCEMFETEYCGYNISECVCVCARVFVCMRHNYAGGRTRARTHTQRNKTKVTLGTDFQVAMDILWPYKLCTS